jgi:hypothetical protein
MLCVLARVVTPPDFTLPFVLVAVPAQAYHFREVGGHTEPESTLVRPDRSDACDVGGEEVDAVSVEVATGAVVVLGGAGVGVAGEGAIPPPTHLRCGRNQLTHAG